MSAVKQNVLKYAKTAKVSLILAGHSLGGSLAAAAATVNDLPAYTLNAKGVHPNTLEPYNETREDATEHVLAANIPSEVLTGLQDLVPGLLSAVGTRNEYEGLPVLYPISIVGISADNTPIISVNITAILDSFERHNDFNAARQGILMESWK